MSAGNSALGVRVDIWLWAARMFKTRAQAKAAIEAGRVQIGGVACKPSRLLHVDDVLLVSRAQEQFHLRVVQLATQRGPASVARTLYHEDEESIAARKLLNERLRLEGAGFRPPPSRPDKQQRRQLRRLHDR